MNGDRGTALVVAMMAVALLSALALSLSVLTSIETKVAANFSTAHEMMAAAETALEFAVRETLGITDWSGIAAGSTRSVFVDGAPLGPRTLADGSTVDLTALTATLGDDSWRLFAYGELDRLEDVRSNAYIVVWAAPEPPGQSAVVALRADAFGPSGSRRGAQVTISRLGVLFWKDVR
jgi:hypothetical protein